MNKKFIIGKIGDAEITCEVSLENRRLSIQGSYKGSGGQVISEFKEHDSRGYLNLSQIEPAKNWNSEKIVKFFDIWDKWHLNNMRAGCIHQRELNWHKIRIIIDEPSENYGLHYPGQKQPSWNLFSWIREEEHPQGLLCKPCPVCGYKYGTSWLFEEIPTEVVEFLEEIK